jgi:hypothetical protein
LPIFEFNKPETFKPAIDKAWEDLLVLEPETVVENTKVMFNETSRAYKVPVLGKEYKVMLDIKEIQYPGGSVNEHIYGAMTVLVLHYLINAKQTTLKNKLITYRELPDGMVFYNAFRSIAIQPIADKFGNDLDTFAKSAETIGGRKVHHGEIAYEFLIFPRVPVTYILWAGDEEIPGSANILFDESASKQLHTEDLAEVGEVITHYLLNE